MYQWWQLGSFVIFQGVWTSIAKKPYILWFFRSGGGGESPDPLSGSANDFLWEYWKNISQQIWSSEYQIYHSAGLRVKQNILV